MILMTKNGNEIRTFMLGCLVPTKKLEVVAGNNLPKF